MISRDTLMVRPRARGIKPGPFAWMSEGFCVCGGPPTEGVLGVVVASVDVLEFGNWGARKTALGSRCAEVQAEVNRILDGGSSDSGKGPGNLPGYRALV